MQDDFKKAVVGAFKVLLESKHLFQGVEVKTEHLFKPEPKKQRFSTKTPPLTRVATTAGEVSSGLSSHVFEVIIVMALGYLG